VVSSYPIEYVPLPHEIVGNKQNSSYGGKGHGNNFYNHFLASKGSISSRDHYVVKHRCGALRN